MTGDADHGVGGNRTCTNCGKSVEDLPYEFWLFHTCRSCAAERTPKRWSDTGTCRKWRYFPRWHMVAHPAVEKAREQHEGAVA